MKNALNSSSLEKKDRVNAFYNLENHAKANTTANHPFLVYEGTTWTYKEAYVTVLKYAAWLKTNYAIAPKEVVALDFMNSPKFIFIWLALWSLGASPAFINYNLTSKPLLHCVKTSTARIIFVDDEVKEMLSSDVLEALGSVEFRDGKGPVEVVYFGADLEQEILTLEGFREPDTSRSGATMTSMSLLIYTSGTTGNPKPAIVAWSKAHVGGILMKSWMGWKPRTDRFYSVCNSSIPGSRSMLIRSIVHASLPFYGHRTWISSCSLPWLYLHSRAQVQQSHFLARGPC